MRLSARNTLKGEVIQVEPGPINAEVTIALAGGAEIVSIITRQSAERLGLTPGKPVYAVIRASDVMVAVD